MNISIKRASEVDARQLFELNELFNGTGSTTMEKLTDSIKNNRQEIVYTAYEEDTMAGFICGQVFMSMCYDTYYGEISELFVKEEYRRQGIAGRLMEAMEEEFKKNNIFSFQLFTGADNLAAQTFYASRGYIRSEELMYRKRVPMIRQSDHKEEMNK